ncbi:phosphomannomutase CpsG [Methylophaga sp. SB9B]|uniref:phosphomannomutase CpsG n=1 Tax=Methylophaga sp. SB9B TaxID=2570356 RepID=UPI0010A809DE|nr:phosphomannomutase CpsG [Methylophaga sp. SB9B]THK43285.1 phosphomannomutase CpsG [Methylophaga sp. SB9B]
MVTENTLKCFKAYDIRGKLGEELNPDVAYRIGHAYAKHLNAKKVVVGGDIRHTSEPLKLALAQGLMDAGSEVIDIGMVGTEEIYFASFYLDVDGGIEVTASHNPMDYNGMKLVGRGALPISGDSGLNDIRDLAEKLVSPFGQAAAVPTSDAKTINSKKMDYSFHWDEQDSSEVITTSEAASSSEESPLEELPNKALYHQQSILDPYVEHLLTYINLTKLNPLKLVVNAGNGAAGHVIDAIENQFKSANVPVEFIKVHHEADGSFPNGIPNPLLPENRAATADAVISNKADMGIAWDGDFDRCFLFDENGRFIEGYYIVGLLAEAFLLKSPGEKIIHDPRLTWNTIDQVEVAGGKPIQSKTGHAFIKERMRLENAVYGGEMSAHHYFRDFAYCDSGMIPWLLVAELISVAGKPLSELVNERMAKYPCSGEINYRVADVSVILDKILKHFSTENPVIDRTDGISLEFPQWRFNLRSSNTEPLLRLNVESRADEALMKAKVAEIEKIIQS